MVTCAHRAWFTDPVVVQVSPEAKAGAAKPSMATDARIPEKMQVSIFIVRVIKTQRQSLVELDDKK